MALKAQDLQEVQISIANTFQTADVVVTHGLQGPESPTPTVLTPDMICCEIVNFTKDVAAAPVYGVISRIQRDVPVAGKTTISGYIDAANDKATAVVLTVRVNSVYWYTMFGADRTP